MMEEGAVRWDGSGVGRGALAHYGTSATAAEEVGEGVAGVGGKERLRDYEAGRESAMVMAAVMEGKEGARSGATAAAQGLTSGSVHKAPHSHRGKVLNMYPYHEHEFI